MMSFLLIKKLPIVFFSWLVYIKDQIDEALFV